MLSVAELPLEPVAQTLAVDEAGAGEVEIEIAEDAAAGQLAGELFQFVEMSGRIAAADDRADRCAGDDVGLDPGFGERLEDTDVSPAARRATTQRQPDLRLGHVRYLLWMSVRPQCVRLLNARLRISCPDGADSTRPANVSIRFRYKGPRLTLHYVASRLALRCDYVRRSKRAAAASFACVRLLRRRPLRASNASLAPASPGTGTIR